MADPNAVLADIGAFNRGQMNHVEVTEKQVLPDQAQVESERKEAQLLREIETGRELKHVEVQERACLPDATAIAEEKAALGNGVVAE